ncbi:hypothetical protein KM043_002466 [Ampulex compressa]|nr:hypothetical protein KM043_002466 [Ampulex compressa]
MMLEERFRNYLSNVHEFWEDRWSQILISTMFWSFQEYTHQVEDTMLEERISNYLSNVHEFWEDRWSQMLFSMVFETSAWRNGIETLEASVSEFTHSGERCFNRTFDFIETEL